MNNPKLKSALIGGGVFGVLSALPYVNLVNALCCALYVGGGVLAVYLYLKDAPPAEKSPYGAGALVGMLAGVFGAVAATLTTVLVQISGLAEDEGARALAMLEQFGVQLPPGVAEMVLGGSGFSLVATLTSLVAGIVLYGIFATLGGLLGVAFFHKKDES